MKQFISIITFLCLFAVVSSAQRFDVKALVNDTLTNADAATTTIDYFLKGKYVVQYQVHADSLSGSTAGTTVLQVASCESCTDWANYGDAITINGVTTDEVKTATIYGGKVRLRTTTTGTQSTEVSHYIILSKEQ